MSLIPDEDLRVYLLAEIKTQALRARLLAADIESVGIALSHSLIGIHGAAKALKEAGAWPLLVEVPDKPREPRK